jgi:hypothetical protein
MAFASVSARRTGSVARLARLALHAAPALAVVVAGAYAVACGDLISATDAVDAGADADTTPTTEDDAGSVPIVPIADASDGAVVVDCAAEDAGFGAPNDLACTGLYSDFATRTIAAANRAFDPGLHLWSDGAEKARWIYLPPGQKIDTTDMNEWRMPVGTRAWKEFKISGHRVETRMFWKRGTNDWVRATYRWSDDETQATSLEVGDTNVGGTTYTIPTIQQCDTCHAGRIDHLLGFEAVSLSQPTATGMTVQVLAAQSLLTTNPTSSLAIPNDSTGKAAGALGWMHANCGTACHNGSPGSFAGATALWLRLDVQADGTLGALKDTNTWKTAVGVTPDLEPFRGRGWKRITPNDPFVGDGLSLLPYRDGKRNETGIQMPPIATSIPDLANDAMVKDWIKNGNFQ